MRFSFFLLTWNVVESFCGLSSTTPKHISPQCPKVQLQQISRTINNARSTLLAKAAEKDEETFDLGDYQIKDPKFLKRSKKWVVVVDDEEAIRLAVGDYLYDQGYQVTACADADSLLEVCAKPRSDGELPVPPDVIIRYVLRSY
jgi:PleD family two-component response regulator